MRGPKVDITGTTDVSAPMNQFMAGLPAGATVDLECFGRYRMDSTLLLRHHRDITINGNEAAIIATTRGTRTRANVRIQDSAGTTISRLHAVGANPHAGLADAAYVAELEAQHGFDVLNSTDTRLSDCGARDTYGDFLYCGGGAGGAGVVGALIERFVGVRNGRQGIAISNGDQITIDGPVLSDCRRAMFDFECDTETQRVTNIAVSRGLFGAHRLNWVSGHGNGQALVGHISFTDCVMRGGAMSVDVTAAAIAGELARRFDWNFLRCTSDLPYNNAAARAAMTFKNTTGINVVGCRQPMKGTGMHMVTVHRSRQVNVTGNTGANLAGQLLVAVP